MKTTRINCPQEMIPELISYLRGLERKGIKSIYLGPDDGRAGRAPGGRRTVDHGHVKEKPTETQEQTATVKTQDTPAKAQPATTAAAKTKSTGDVAKQLAELEKVVLACTDCGLHEGRTNGVFGTGSHTTRVMFIGEGPGAEEDKQGKPFVGRSGQLLTKMIEAIELTRDDVYIANIVKCRPPNNRDPLEEEVRCCEKYLIHQIQLIKPRVICALGRVSAHWLLQTDESLGAMRRADNRYQDTPVLVTYHPAALLRNPNLKRDAWEDFKKLRDMIAD